MSEKEIKPRSFRINDETAEKFKEISATIGGNQQETLAKLIESYEFQAGKAVLTEKKDDIEQFERYAAILTRMFMSSLEDNQNARTTIRTEFEALLQSKDNTIQTLQAQAVLDEAAKQQAIEHEKLQKEENKRLRETLETKEKEYHSRISDLEKMLADKDSLNKALTDSSNSLQKKVDEMTQEHTELKQVKKTLLTVQTECESLKQAKAEAELEKEKATLNLEKKYQKQIQELKEQYQTKIEKYQQKYLELLEKLEKLEK